MFGLQTIILVTALVATTAQACSYAGRMYQVENQRAPGVYMEFEINNDAKNKVLCSLELTREQFDSGEGWSMGCEDGWRASVDGDGNMMVVALPPRDNVGGGTFAVELDWSSSGAGKTIEGVTTIEDSFEC